MNRTMMVRPYRAAQVAAFLLASATAALNANGAAFISGNNIVVARIGDGVTTYAPSDAAPVFLDEYDTTTGARVNSVPFASTGAASLTETFGTGGRDGYLTLSPDGKYLAFAGYRKDAGGAAPSGDTATVTPRVVGIVNAAGVADTSTALTNFSTTVAFRSAVTTDGTNIYVTGNSGGTNSIGYTTRGSSSATPINVTNAAGFRSVNVAGGQLYASTGSTPKGTFRITDSTGTIPTGTVTASQTEITRGSSTDSVSDTVFLDLDPNTPGIDTAYLAESDNFAKFSLVGSTWTFNGSIAATGYITGVAAKQQIGSVALFFSTDAGIYKFTDSGYNTTFSGTQGSAFIAPGANQTFRGVAFAPTVPEPTSIAMFGLGALLLGARRRRA